MKQPDQARHDEHDHGDERGHDHAEIGQSERPGYYEIMEIAVRELLIERRLIGPDEIRRQIEVLDSRSPALGAKVVARAPGSIRRSALACWSTGARPARNWASA